MKTVRPPLLCLLVLFALPVVGWLHFWHTHEPPESDSLILKRPPPWPSEHSLVVLTRNAPTTYYEGPDGPMGFEYELFKAFAAHLGVPFELKVLDSVESILDTLEWGEGDFAAAGLVRTPQRRQSFLFGPPYQYIRQQVVCRRGNIQPKSIEDLLFTHLVVVAKSSYVERLEALREEHFDLFWETVHGCSTEKLLEMVWCEEIECTIADSNIVAINRRYFPELTVAMNLGDRHGLHWLMRPEDTLLKAHMEYWLQTMKRSGRLDALLAKYYAHVEIFDYVDIAIYHRRIRERLPEWLDLFNQAALQYELPWELLAAVSYQESHWDNEVVSPTGVRGLMMLTERTARSLGVEDRLDPVQSIAGGARYLKKLLGQVPAAVSAPDDRLKFALAAYNVGMSHIHDAQILARRLEKNPDTWHDLRTVLPLLAEERYYKTLEHGYARGWEPVRYVQRVIDYLDILRRKDGEIEENL